MTFQRKYTIEFVAGKSFNLNIVDNSPKPKTDLQTLNQAERDLKKALAHVQAEAFSLRNPDNGVLP